MPTAFAPGVDADHVPPVRPFPRCPAEHRQYRPDAFQLTRELTTELTGGLAQPGLDHLSPLVPVPPAQPGWPSYRVPLAPDHMLANMQQYYQHPAVAAAAAAAAEAAAEAVQEARAA